MQRFPRAIPDRPSAPTNNFSAIGPTLPEPSLYERLGGIFPIAAVIDRFSDALVQNPIVGQKSENSALREWHTNNLGRLPGLKFMRTLWVCSAADGPFRFSATRPGRTYLGLEEAHRRLRIKPEEFDAAAAELARTLEAFDIPEPEKQEVLGAFAAHKQDVTEGYRVAVSGSARPAAQGPTSGTKTARRSSNSSEMGLLLVRVETANGSGESRTWQS